MDLRRRLRWPGLFFVAYLAVAMVITWPLVLELGSALPGPSSDSYVHYWNGWWVKQALLAGQSPYHTNYIFYPHGVSLVMHNLAWMTIAPWLLLQLFLPGVVAYNLVLLLNLALCGLTSSLLVNYLTGKRLASFTAGLIYLAWPFRITQLDHPNLISTYWLPVALLLLILWMREGRWRHAVLAGIALALVGYTRWQMLIPAAFVILVYLVGVLPTWVRSRRKWLGLALSAGIAAVLLAPPALLLVGEWQTTVTSRDDLLFEGEEAVMQTDLLAYVTPGSNHPLWGDVFKPYYDQYYADRSAGRRFRAYLGLTTVILAAIGLWRKWRESRPWLLVALILMALAMGSVSRIGGRLYPEIPTLYRLLEPFYIVRLIRVPDRFNVTLALPVAVMAGYGLATLLAQFRPRRRLLAGGLSLLILFEYLAAPIPRLGTEVSPFYRQLAGEPSSAVLLTLPVDLQKAKVYMYEQTIHGRPLVQGKVARIPHNAFDYVDADPWLASIHQVSEFAPWLTHVSEHLRRLAGENVDYIVLDKTAVDPDRVLHWQRYLAMAPRYEDEQIAVYSTTPEAGRDFALRQELAPGLGPVQVLTAGDCVQAGDVVAVDVAWGTNSDVERGYDIELILVGERGDVVQREEFAEALPALGANSLMWHYLQLETGSGLAAGSYELMVTLDSAATGSSNGGAEQEALRVGALEIRDRPCQSDELPGDAVVADARFGNRMRLLGYDVQREGERLVLTLYWRLMQHMDTDYKVFVHVFEPGTGVPVAQDDMMPHRGGYPTRFWAAGETVVDRIAIDLGAAASAGGGGDYGIAVGVYDPLTLERLELIDGSGQVVEDGRLVLPDEVVRIGLRE